MRENQTEKFLSPSELDNALRIDQARGLTNEELAGLSEEDEEAVQSFRDTQKTLKSKGLI